METLERIYGPVKVLLGTLFFYKQPGCLALTRKFCPKVKQLAKQPLRVKSETKFPKLTNSLSF